MIISISGFLSENDTHSDSWKGLLDLTNNPVYSFNWKSKKVFDMISATLSLKQSSIPRTILSFFVK